jgi:phosphoribosyl 1,2-cyclic phosphodiesterase
LKATFWGVRGSIPVPGPETARYGGNTLCVEITDGENDPLILDAGTGCWLLGKSLQASGASRADLLLTHFHLDHVGGFPFLMPLFSSSFQLRVMVPEIFGQSAKDYFARFIGGVFHPLSLPGFPASIEFVPVHLGSSFACGTYQIRTAKLNHPGGAYAFRIEKGGHSIAYVSDTAPLAEVGEGVAAGKPPTADEQQLIELMNGVDMVIFDCFFYSAEEYLEKRSWGHSYPDYAVAMTAAAGARSLYLYHHAQDANDEFLDRLAARWATHKDPVVHVAQEGGTVDLEG